MRLRIGPGGAMGGRSCRLTSTRPAARADGAADQPVLSLHARHATRPDPATESAMSPGRARSGAVAVVLPEGAAVEHALSPCPPALALENEREGVGRGRGRGREVFQGAVGAGVARRACRWPCAGRLLGLLRSTSRSLPRYDCQLSTSPRANRAAHAGAFVLKTRRRRESKLRSSRLQRIAWES
jgi:hypothetical protein